MSEEKSMHSLVRARRRCNLSQRALAELAGVSLPTVQRAEAGKSIRADCRQLLCDYFSSRHDRQVEPQELGLVYLEEGKERQESSDVSSATHENFSEPSQDGNRETSSGVIRLTSEQVASLLQLLALGEITMTHFDPQRRAALLQLLSALSTLAVLPQAFTDPDVWERLNASKDTPSRVDLTTLEQFEKLAVTCWDLSNSGQLQMAERILPTFLPDLIQLAPSHPKAASLASQGLRLQSVLVAHQLRLADKVTLCEQAVAYARQSNDYNALVAALLELNVAFRYTQRYENAFKICQEALSYSHQVSPLVQSRVYIKAAEAYSRHDRRKEAEFYIHLAYETFPNQPEEHDPLTFASYNSIFGLVLSETISYLNLGEGAKALEAFDERLKEHKVFAVPERLRLEVVNLQGRAAIMSNDLDTYASHLGDGIAGAIALKSKKRFDEAYSSFKQEMPRAWLKDAQIKELSERYRLIA
jgi:tetratricopeptide (TPR) repeat protein